MTIVGVASVSERCLPWMFAPMLLISLPFVSSIHILWGLFAVKVTTAKVNCVVSTAVVSFGMMFRNIVC